LRVGSGTEAEGGWEVATGLAAHWDRVDLELFLVVDLVVVDLAFACGGGAVVGGGAEGVAELAVLVTGTTMAPTPAAVAAREELGGEAGDVDLLWASGVEVVPWAGGGEMVFWTVEVVLGGWLLGEL